jgi:hypothetical protein
MPVIEQGSLWDTRPGSPKLCGHFISRSHEVYQFGHQPHEGVADKVFFHHPFTFRVATFSRVAGEHKAGALIYEETCLSPKPEIFSVEPCMCFVDNYASRISIELETSLQVTYTLPTCLVWQRSKRLPS